MNFIIAKFSSNCVETGTTTAKGENCLYDRVTKKIYCRYSKKFQAEQETENTSSLIEAQENAYFDNFCQTNDI
jgi:hypothetical protein